MDFIKPKNTNKEDVSFKISHKTKLIIEYYAKYTEYEEATKDTADVEGDDF
jgi:hypothetical protein